MKLSKTLDFVQILIIFSETGAFSQKCTKENSKRRNIMCSLYISFYYRNDIRHSTKPTNIQYHWAVLAGAASRVYHSCTLHLCTRL